jgi:hypothetical protein
MGPGAAGTNGGGRQASVGARSDPEPYKFSYNPGILLGIQLKTRTLLMMKAAAKLILNCQ